MFQLFNRLKQKMLGGGWNILPRSGFTFIEILVVVTIISLLAAGHLVSYSTLTKNSLDARRKADLELIRIALEMYRSSSDVGSYPVTLSSTLQDASGNTYLETVPKDPKNQTNYSYSPSPSDCNGASTPCTSYSLSATLESGEIYTVTPYGSSTVTPTPTSTP